MSTKPTATRRPFVAGNWKCFKKQADARALATELRGRLAELDGVEVAVAPTFLSIAAVREVLAGSKISVAAQNCYSEDEGAFTGEVSAAMCADAGCSYVIVGHSERRQHFGETDLGVHRKAASILQAGLSPIICVGETEAERDRGETLGRIEAQLTIALHGATDGPTSTAIGEVLANRVVIAYEPVWAIGTGRTATPAQAQEVHAAIRGLLRRVWGAAAEGVRIQYGGSVKPDNVAAIMAQPDIDGALVGGASLQASSFVTICQQSEGTTR